MVFVVFSAPRLFDASCLIGEVGSRVAYLMLNCAVAHVFAGTFNDQVMQSACALCQPGYFNGVLGQTVCQPVADGACFVNFCCEVTFFLKAQELLGQVSLSPLILHICRICVPTIAGYYSSNGASAPSLCDGGYACTNQSTNAKQQTCAPSYYCPSGSKQQMHMSFVVVFPTPTVTFD
jgi:hypothetical protein